MTNGQPDSEMSQTPNNTVAVSRKLDAIGWGLFFIWMGIGFLLDVGWGWGMVGIAAIILGEALIRRNLNMNVGRFWVVVGFLFLAGGLWELFEVQGDIGPFVIIAIGAALVWGAVSGKHVMKK